MFAELISLSHCLSATRPSASKIAYHTGRFHDISQFHQDVKSWVNKLKSQPAQRYALFTEDAYPFAVMLFALFHAGKEAWIPGNNRPGTASQLRQLDCQPIGDWSPSSPFDYCLESTDCSDLFLYPLDPVKTKLVIFTSGSTGQPKPVVKQLIQFQLEIETLEKKWGRQLAEATALATVSHQHIYGLLFRVLWPLSAGRCFHSDCYINPETLLKGAQNEAAYWIASPAHLKRLDQDTPWDNIKSLKAIFSSGGPLQSETAQQILEHSEQRVIEIYGSTESGGIGWRVQGNEPFTPWTLFEGISLTQSYPGWQLHSPYLQIPPSPPFEGVVKVEIEPSPSGRGQGEGMKINVLPCLFPLTPTPLPRGEGLLRQPPFPKGGDSNSLLFEKEGYESREDCSAHQDEKGWQKGFLLDDQISLLDDGRFILHGRLDRIVKIEEKRLSLTELEQRLMAMPCVAETFSLMLTRRRDIVGAVIVLTEEGLHSMQAKGRKPIIKQFRDALFHYFDAVVLPRKWLFLERMPLTAEGKIEQQILIHLLNMDSRKLPYVSNIEKTGESLELKLNVPEDLIYFQDHFPSYPILPGVVQIAWTEHFGRLFFNMEEPFLHMEAVKFVQVIRPGAALKLSLTWKALPGKLSFNFSSASGTHSSGRMVYGYKG